MGYTHHWYRQKTIKTTTYKFIVDDFQKLLPVFDRNDTPLAGGTGEGYPIINYDEVIFNGSAHCGHPVNKELIIPWPSATAKGLGNKPNAIINGQRFASATVDARTCNGNCSYETFYFPRIIEDIEPASIISYHDMSGKPVYNNPKIVGKYSNCTKTAFRPYDWAVTAFLIIAKHYLGNKILVHSDGHIPQWQDAMLLCQLELGYGLDFQIDD